MPVKALGIDKFKVFDALGYKPHSKQQHEAHVDTSRFKVVCCGRRWGKTTFGARELTAALMDHTKPDSYYWIVGPTYSTGEKEFRIVYKDIIQRLGLRGKLARAQNNVNQGQMMLEMPWGSVLEVKSADKKDSLIGEGLDGMILSEAAAHDSDVWEMYLQPALTDKRGWAIFPSTPRGYNWYEGLYRLGEDLEMEDYRSWRFPSWTNPIAHPKGFSLTCRHLKGTCRCEPELVQIWRNVTRAHFLQEYAAQFTAFEGQIYDEFDRNIHVTDVAYEPAWRNYWAVDFGFKDPFVVLDVMVDSMDNVYVWREYQVSYLSTWEHCLALKNRENPLGYHFDSIYADPRGADEIATLNIHFGAVIAPDVPWSQGVEAVGRWIKLQPDGKPKLFIDRSCFNTIRQVEQLRHKTVKEGQNVKKEGQHDYDDHGADALRYFFGPHFVLGHNSHLSDIYGSSGPTQGDTFFQLHKGITLDSTLSSKVPF